MDWEKYWDQTASAGNHLMQVGRINANQEIAIAQAGERIIELLQLQPGDSVLDICCGNGLITDYIGKKGIDITGVDLSENLIQNARNNNASITFLKQDALNLKLEKKFDKIYLAFSFQYFETFEKGQAVIRNMVQQAKPGANLLLTDIPDASKWSVFYDTLLKKIFYFKQKLTGKLVMGKFWSATEMQQICDTLKVKGEWLAQPSDLPYSRYRFDFRITV